MPNRSRTTQHSTIGRAFGGRGGFVFQELDGRNRPHENHFRFGRLVPSAEMVICLGIVLVFVGGFAAFIAALALTR